MQVVDTEFGRLYVLLCGDLFDDGVKAKRNEGADILIVLPARSFDRKSPDLERWLKEERQVYAEEVKKVGIAALLVNALEDSSLVEASFGGAMVAGPNGEILAETLHGTDKMLIFDLIPANRNSG